MVTEAPPRTQLLAGFGLVCVTTSVGVLYKVSQSAAGGFSYSTTSAITMSEFCKFVMSCSLHLHNTAQRKEGFRVVSSACASARSQLSLWAAMQILTLSFLYTLNNQVSFYVYTLADPGTIFLFKSSTTMLTAGMQCVFAGKTFLSMQWQAMVLQGVGMVIVQYDPCKSRTMYDPLVYGYMAITVVVTALTSARNEHLVKNYAIDIHVQNAVLYAGGLGMNLAAFYLLPNPNSSEASIGFFDGYGPLAVAVVVANSIIGLAVTMVYKYADAVVKCIAGNVTSVLLLVYSAIFLKVEISLVMWMGVFVVAFGVNLYVQASKTVVLSASGTTGLEPLKAGSPSSNGVAGAANSSSSPLKKRRPLKCVS